jgi:hypothetical protein
MFHVSNLEASGGRRVVSEILSLSIAETERLENKAFEGEVSTRWAKKRQASKWTDACLG